MSQTRRAAAIPASYVTLPQPLLDAGFTANGSGLWHKGDLTVSLSRVNRTVVVSGGPAPRWVARFTSGPRAAVLAFIDAAEVTR